jgi:hypothetical protein
VKPQGIEIAGSPRTEKAYVRNERRESTCSMGKVPRWA